jgi:hypothetical protein
MVRETVHDGLFLGTYGVADDAFQKLTEVEKANDPHRYEDEDRRTLSRTCILEKRRYPSFNRIA